MPAVALAHHPEISATPDCMLADGSWYLDYTAWAWVETGYYPNPTDAQRTHPKIDIYVNGVYYESGAFNPDNDFTFSGTILLPAGTDPAVVTAVADPSYDWGSGHTPAAGEERSADPVYKPTEMCDSPGTGTPGYWHKIDHWEDWNLSEVTIGGVVYSAEGAIDIINKPVKGDKTLTMFPALVSAVLNVQIGNDPSCIAATITAADLWMTANPPESGVKANSSDWDVGGPLASMLDKYNNGKLCAPHRD